MLFVENLFPLIEMPEKSLVLLLIEIILLELLETNKNLLICLEVYSLGLYSNSPDTFFILSAFKTTSLEISTPVLISILKLLKVYSISPKKSISCKL